MAPQVASGKTEPVEPVDCGRALGWRRGRRLAGGSPSGPSGGAHRALEAGTGFIFVVKTFVLDTQDEPENPQLGDVVSELRRWSTMKHPNLVRVLGHDLAAQTLHLRTEYVPQGSLGNYIASFGALPENIVKRVTKGLVTGLHFLHTQQPPIAHGNIKDTNILLDSESNVKLTDYGYASLQGVTLAGPVNISSLAWTAPEVAQRRCADLTKADIWGVGCAVIETSTAEPPWGRRMDLDMLRRNLLDGEVRAMPPIPLAGEGLVFVERCLRLRPAARDGAAQLLNQAFLKQR